MTTTATTREMKVGGRQSSDESLVSRAPILTPREMEIARLVAKGCSNPEIARLLGISLNAVKQALKRVFLKAGVSARAELVAALGLGL